MHSFASFIFCSDSLTVIHMYVQQVVWEVPQVEKQYMILKLRFCNIYIYFSFSLYFFPKLLSWLKAAAANQIGYNH